MTETMRTVEIPWERVDRAQPVIVAVKDDRTATVEYKRATFNSTVDAGDNVMDPVRARVAGFAENAGRPALAVVIYDVREDPEHYLMVCTDEGDLVPDDYADDEYEAATLAQFKKWLADNGIKTKRKRAGSSPSTSVEHIMDTAEPEPSAVAEPGPEPTVVDEVEEAPQPAADEEPGDDALTAMAESAFVKPERTQDTSVTGPTIHRHVASDSPFKSTGLMEEGKHNPRAKHGWQGAINNLLNTNLAPGPAETARRESVADIVAGWPGVKRVAVVNDKGGAGKALSVDEPVQTPTGPRRIGDLTVGDMVLGVDGEPYPVLGVYPQGVRELFDVGFSDGTVIRADGEHLWEVYTLTPRLFSSCALPDCVVGALPSGLCADHHAMNFGAGYTGHALVITTAEMLEDGLTGPEGAARFYVTRTAGNGSQDLDVVSVEPAGSGEAVCIAVDSPRHLFLARNHVPTHNTPISILLAAAIARASTLPVAVFDNNESAGMAKDRVEVVGEHDATAKDLATQAAAQEKMSATEVMQYMHYHPEDRYHLLAAHHPRIVDNEVDPPLNRDEVGAVYRALAEPYRLVVTDSGNSWTRENWGAMVARADQLVVPMVTSKDRFRRAEDTLNNLYNLGGVFQDLTRNAVVVVSTWQPGDRAVAADFADRWEGRVREVVVIPYDEHVGSHNLRFDALKPATQDAFLRLGAAVVRGLRGE